MSGGIGVNAPKSKIVGILMTCFAAFGGILFGYDTGTISGLQQMPDWLETFGHPVPVSTTFPNGYGISSSQRSLVVSILSAGTFFGALLAAPFGDFLGRKWGLVASCLVFCVGVAMQTAATKLPLFVVGRVWAGLGVGLVSTLVPMYQSECAPKWIRGAIVGLYQFAITIGLLLAAIFNNATKNRPNHSSYRIPVAIQFIWAAILAFGMILLPESPRWLIRKHRDADAAHSLSRLTSLHPDDPEVTTELEEIRLNLKHEEALGESSYLDCFRPSDNRILFRTHRHFYPGLATAHWNQLHLLLWYYILHQRRYSQPISHIYCHFHCQCRHDRTRNLGCRALRSPEPANLWRDWHDYMRIHHCDHWFNNKHEQPLCAVS